MLKPVQYSILIALTALGLVLVGINAMLYFSNRSAQAQVAVRGRYIQQSQSIGALYQQMAGALANLAVEHHDDEVTALLQQEGFTVRPREQAGTSAPRGKESNP